jgi:hypothetical protein
MGGPLGAIPGPGLHDMNTFDRAGSRPSLSGARCRISTESRADCSVFCTPCRRSTTWTRLVVEPIHGVQARLVGRRDLPSGSEEDDCVTLRDPSISQGCECGGRGNRERTKNRIVHVPHRGSVRSGVGQQEHNRGDPAISALEGQSSFYRLEVRDPGLSLHSNPLAAQPKKGIPRSQVPGGPERNLGLPGERLCDPLPQSREECDMRLVADGRAGRVGASGQLEPNHAQQSGQVDQ